MMKKHISKCTLAIMTLGLLLWSGCTTSKVSDPRVEITDPLDNSIRIESIDSINNDGESLIVQVSLRNHSPNTLKMLYKVDWFTGDGMVYDTMLSKWKKRQAYGRESFIIKEVAPNPDIVSYRVQIRKD